MLCLYAAASGMTRHRETCRNRPGSMSAMGMLPSGGASSSDDETLVAQVKRIAKEQVNTILFEGKPYSQALHHHVTTMKLALL